MEAQAGSRALLRPSPKGKKCNSGDWQASIRRSLKFIWLPGVRRERDAATAIKAFWVVRLLRLVSEAQGEAECSRRRLRNGSH
jgi:hypothetical protein